MSDKFEAGYRVRPGANNSWIWESGTIQDGFVASPNDIQAFSSPEDLLEFLAQEHLPLVSAPESPEQPAEEPQEAELEIESADDPVYGEGANEPAFSEPVANTNGADAVSPVIDATEDFSDEAVRAAGGEPVSRVDALNAKTLQTPHGEINFASPDFGPTES